MVRHVQAHVMMVAQCCCVCRALLLAAGCLLCTPGRMAVAVKLCAMLFSTSLLTTLELRTHPEDEAQVDDERLVDLRVPSLVT